MLDNTSQSLRRAALIGGESLHMTSFGAAVKTTIDYRFQETCIPPPSQSHFHLRKCPKKKLHVRWVFNPKSSTFQEVHCQVSDPCPIASSNSTPNLRIFWWCSCIVPFLSSVERKLWEAKTGVNLVGFFSKISAANWNVDTRNKNHTSKDMVPKISHRDSRFFLRFGLFVEAS